MENNQTNNVSIYRTGSSDYCYTTNNKEYNIGVKNFVFDNPEGYPTIISNYFIDDDDCLTLFATIVWDDIKYENNDYNPYNYDPDPLMVVYRDDLPKEIQDVYLTIIDQLCNEFYEPTTHFKHFNPQLPKIKLSEFTDTEFLYIYNTFKSLISKFTCDE